jgi:hypothetical protein
MIASITRYAALALTVGAFLIPSHVYADEMSDFVVQKAYNAALSGDTATAMDMVTDDVILSTLPPQDHPIWGGKLALMGKATIGAWWEFLASDNSSLKIVSLKVDGDRAMFMFEFRGGYFKDMGIDPALSDGVAILRDGKIAGLMMAFRPEVEEALTAAGQ